MPQVANKKRLTFLEDNENAVQNFKKALFEDAENAEKN